MRNQKWRTTTTKKRNRRHFFANLCTNSLRANDKPQRANENDTSKILLVCNWDCGCVLVNNNNNNHNVDRKAFGFLINLTDAATFTLLNTDLCALLNSPMNWFSLHRGKCKRLNVEAILLLVLHRLWRMKIMWQTKNSISSLSLSLLLLFLLLLLLQLALILKMLDTCIFITIMTICIANRIMYYLRMALTSKLF